MHLSFEAIKLNINWGSKCSP